MASRIYSSRKARARLIRIARPFKIPFFFPKGSPKFSQAWVRALRIRRCTGSSKKARTIP